MCVCSFVQVGVECVSLSVCISVSGCVYLFAFVSQCSCICVCVPAILCVKESVRL